jgi:DNA-binding transcriptional LysR family regulator
MEAKFKPQKTLVLKNYETARRLASVGYGISLIPMEYVEIFNGHDDADYYYIEGIDTAYWDTCVAINKSFYLSKAAKSFIELINELNGSYLFKSNTKYK